MGSFKKSVYGPKNSASIPSPVTARETYCAGLQLPCCPCKAHGTMARTWHDVTKWRSNNTAFIEQVELLPSTHLFGCNCFILCFLSLLFTLMMNAVHSPKRPQTFLVLCYVQKDSGYVPHSHRREGFKPHISLFSVTIESCLYLIREFRARKRVYLT
jgi:hypothetical protein